MRTRRLGAVVTLSLLTLAPSNCSGAGNPAPAASSSPSAKAPPGLQPIATDRSCKVMGDLEGKFTKPSQMDDYLACITPAIKQWIGAVYTDMAGPRGYFFVPAGVKGKDGQCEYDAGTLAYCGSSESVYFGEAAVWDQYANHGDAATAVIMAHEVTHHFQNVLHFPPATVPNEQIRYENQADCGAGAFARYANAQGWLNVQDDVVDVAGSLAAAGSGPGPDQDHGTAPQRLLAFARGSVNNEANALRACNRYVPETPLVS